MDHSNIFPLMEPTNEESTQEALSSPTYQAYISWLQSNGCIYPSVHFT